MGAPLRAVDHKHQQVEQIESSQSHEPKAHIYQEIGLDQHVQELVYLMRLVAFAIFTVLSAFVLLSIGTAAVFAFPVGALAGAGITAILTFLITLLKR